MQENLIQQVMSEVQARLGGVGTSAPANQIKHAVQEAAQCMLPEFIGTTTLGDTIGLVIPNVDESLAKAMKLKKPYRALGIFGSRTGAGPHILAADEAVKGSNTEILSIELPRDTKGGAGHGSLIIFGADDVADCQRAINISLDNVERTFGDVYGNDAGHLEFQYTARASYACNMAFKAPLNKAFGLILAAPAAIGVVVCDAAVKAATVDICGYGSPANGTSFSNEAFIMVCGDSAAVRQSVIAGREVGLQLLGAMDTKNKLVSATTPYI